ncbi:MAG: 1-acyl-sn-glycerol-3-phosphate acyltransferase [Actinobacteria bacterium]|nr:1-acyl-sn-glycerol-3-phosphate acyltransferase [Actinomycetota bacterium]
MRAAEIVWRIGRLTLQPLIVVGTRLKVYGKERVPEHGGFVVACNHFSWIDPPALGAASPRTVYYMAKIEAHHVPGLGALIRAFGCFPVRRGESDREAVRMMRQVVADGLPLGLFVEGTRQLSGEPGTVQPGAAMVALQEGVQVIPVAVHGSQIWRVGNFRPVSIAWGTPILIEGLPKGGRGYREASAIIEREIRRLWEFLVDMHAQGRPDGTPPESTAARDG